MLGTAASSSTSSAGKPGRIDTVKSGAVIFFSCGPTITSLALPALGGTILQARKPVLHLGDAALEPCCQGFVGQCRSDEPQ